MAKVSIAEVEKMPAIASSEGVESRAMFGGNSDPIHLQAHRLDPGAGMTVSAGNSDIALFVWKGAVTAGGQELAEKASAIVERGCSLQLAAGAQGATVMAFQLSGTSDVSRAGGHVHLLPSERVPRTHCMGGNEGIGGALHADAGCPTCSVWLHENSYAMADKETALHSHSEDEVIFVHTGSIRLGNRIYGAGTALAIAADTIYGFHSGPDGLGFVNFRGTSPTYTSADGSVVMDEAELWRGILGKPDYIEPA
jgi:hypothetical protein